MTVHHMLALRKRLTLTHGIHLYRSPPSDDHSPASSVSVSRFSVLASLSQNCEAPGGDWVRGLYDFRGHPWPGFEIVMNFVLGQLSYYMQEREVGAPFFFFFVRIQSPTQPTPSLHGPRTWSEVGFDSGCTFGVVWSTQEALHDRSRGHGLLRHTFMEHPETGRENRSTVI